jgi:alpha-D-ribose 1-methylphosphonate 5-phosphate C-P lyase
MMRMRLERLLATAQRGDEPAYNYAFLDEQTKRELRRKTLKAIALPGHQVPFGSREMPLARGWGTGGLQLSLSLIGPGDVYKVMDQGADASVNALNIRRLVERMARVETTVDARRATLIQTRHRVPEEQLRGGQILVLQVPVPEPLDRVEPRVSKTRRMHAEQDYSKMWLYLYEDIARHGAVTIGARYPVLVNSRYLMDPSPIPRWDVPKFHDAAHLSLFGAGTMRRVYAIPPHTRVEPLDFEDHPFEVERLAGPCRLCGSTDTFVTQISDGGRGAYVCSDESSCDRRRAQHPSGGVRA